MWRHGAVVSDDLMGLLGLMVFKRDKRGRFRRVGPVPPWLADFESKKASVDDARDLPFIFLGVFLDACDEALTSDSTVSEMDEVWHERDRHDVERGFRVQLVDMGDVPHLVLRCEDADFAAQQGLFQRAREQRLSLDALAKADAALRESQQRLDLMMHQAPAVFWCADVDGMLTYCSGSARDAFICDGRDPLGASLTLLFRGSDVPQDLVLSAHEIALAGESATFAVSSDGRTFDVRVEPLYDGDERRAMGTIGVGVESTERVRAEARAAAALQAKTDFVTGISHEIRTPMNAIMGLTELTLDLPLSSEQQSYLQSSISSAESLLGVIDQLLDFSRIEHGENTLDCVEFELRDLVTAVLSGLAVHAHGKGVELTSVVGDTVPTRVAGDSGRLRQVLVNLVSNAVKFTPEGEIRVHVEREPAGGDDATAVMLHFVVSDTGIGVGPEKQELIFDAFRQAEPGTIRKYGGTGLGLSIALELTRLLGGRIWVVSPGADGVGSEFHFTAALAEAEDAVATEDAEPLRPSSCLLVGMSGTPYAATRRLLRSQFGEIAEIEIPTDATERVPVPVADASGVVVLELPAAHDARTRMLNLLDGIRDCASHVVAISPVGLPPSEKESLAGLSNHVVLKPVRPDALRVALQEVDGYCRSSGAAPRAGATSSRLRILIAEDDELSQWVLASICRNRGHDVALVSNGADAVIQAEEREFDVLLLDIQMPDCDGYEVALRIRRSEGRQTGRAVRLPIIALTAHIGVEIRDRCTASGMDGYLAKPVRARELFSKLEMMLVSKDAGGEPADGTSPSDPLDWEQLQAFVGGDAAVRQKVLASAGRLLDPALATIEAALQRMDFASAQKEAHRLKGMAGNIGARDVADVASSLETSAARQDLGGGRARLVELRSEADRLGRFLEERAAGGGGASS